MRANRRAKAVPEKATGVGVPPLYGASCAQARLSDNADAGVGQRRYFAPLGTDGLSLRQRGICAWLKAGNTGTVREISAALDDDLALLHASFKRLKARPGYVLQVGKTAFITSVGRPSGTLSVIWAAGPELHKQMPTHYPNVTTLACALARRQPLELAWAASRGEVAHA